MLFSDKILQTTLIVTRSESTTILLFIVTTSDCSKTKIAESNARDLLEVAKPSGEREISMPRPQEGSDGGAVQ